VGPARQLLLPPLVPLPCITARRAAGCFTRLPRLPPSSRHQEHLKHRPPPPPLTPLPFPLQLIAPFNAIKAAPMAIDGRSSLGVAPPPFPALFNPKSIPCAPLSTPAQALHLSTLVRALSPGGSCRRAIASAWSPPDAGGHLPRALFVLARHAHRSHEDPTPLDPYPTQPSRSTRRRRRAKVNSHGRRPCFVSIVPPSSPLPSQAQVHQGLILTRGSTQPRLQPPPRRAPVIPTATHCRTSSTPPHRRQRASGEPRDVLLFLPVQTASQIVHRSAQTAVSGEVSGEPPPLRCRRRPSPRRPSPTCDRGRPMGTDGPDQKGGVPLGSVHGGPVDRVHRDGPRATS
jgi:hypothetical protein